MTQANEARVLEEELDLRESLLCWRRGKRKDAERGEREEVQPRPHPEELTRFGRKSFFPSKCKLSVGDTLTCALPDCGGKEKKVRVHVVQKA